MTSAIRPTAHILLVDDDDSIRELVHRYLTDYDMVVTGVPDGAGMWAALERTAFDVLVMDVRLQSEDGLQLASAVRATSTIPIIMLTARSEEADRVMALELAADDYLTKPFSMRELLARIRALARRAHHVAVAPRGPTQEVRAYRFAGYELNVPLRRLVRPDGSVEAIPNGEMSILLALLSAPGRVLDRDTIIGKSRLHASEVSDRSVDLQIGRIRRRFDASPHRADLIVTERGLGYRFSASVEVVHFDARAG